MEGSCNGGEGVAMMGGVAIWEGGRGLQWWEGVAIGGEMVAIGGEGMG